MLRKVAILVVSAGLMMTPLAVQALGFGGIKLNSSLNEKLSAEVALLSATANDIQSLTIKLATEEAFLRSGIERTALLNKLKFKVKQRANGDYYIKVTTTQTVREPFMNFLLELDWKNGRMLREYTMLIDPPGRAPQLLAKKAPVIAETIAPEVEEVEAPYVEESTPFVEPVTEPDYTPMPEAVEVDDNVVIDEPPLDAFNPDVVEPEAELEAVAEPEPVVEIEAEVEIEPVVEAVDEVAVDMEPVADVLEPEVVDVEPVAELESSADVFDEPTSAQLWPSIPLEAFDKSDDYVDEDIAATDVEVEEVAEVEAELGDLDYGIIKKGDNLWNIAEKLRQGDESVSVHQVMMALLQNNPDAFTDNNVHRLKVGHVFTH